MFEKFKLQILVPVRNCGGSHSRFSPLDLPPTKLTSTVQRCSTVSVSQVSRLPALVPHRACVPPDPRTGVQPALSKNAGPADRRTAIVQPRQASALLQ
jgi:hypothetical protein